jgi:vitamin B12 transporter
MFEVNSSLSKRHSCLVLISALSFCILSSASFAQSSAGVTVTDIRNQLDPIIVTATRTQTEAKNVLSDYVYIGPEEIAQAAQTSLADLLQQQRGIQISSYGGQGNLSSVNLRGTSNSQSILLIDGVRVDTSAAGGPILNQIPLALIDHIEIVYGAQSTLYGANAIGGVIQVFTKSGEGPPQLTASSGYGSYGTSINNASASGSIDGNNKTRYSIGVSQENSTGFNTVAPNNACSSQNPNNGGCIFPTGATGYTRLGTNVQLSQEWSKGQEFGVKVFASTNSYQYPNSTGQGYNADNVTPVYSQGMNRYSSFTAFTKNQITDIWQSNFQVSSISNSQQTLWSGNSTVAANDKIDMPEYDFLWQNNIKVGQDNLQLLAERRNQYVYVNNSDNLSGCITNGVACIVDAKRTTNSLALSYDLKRGNHLATFSMRNDAISGFDPKSTGGIAYGYFFTNEWRANLGYSTGYRVPTFNDLYYPNQGNTNLTPEYSRNIEAGLNYNTKNWNNHVSAYQNRISNFIEPNLSNPVNACNIVSCKPINLGMAQIRGVSAGSTTFVGPFMIKASADYLRAIDMNTDLYLPRRANFTSNLAGEYRSGKVMVGTNYTYTGKTFDSLNNSTAYINNPYSLLSLYSSYQFEPRWNIFTRWNNITNTQYQNIYGFKNMGSNIFVGVKYATN